MNNSVRAYSVLFSDISEALKRTRRMKLTVKVSKISQLKARSTKRKKVIGPMSNNFHTAEPVVTVMKMINV